MDGAYMGVEGLKDFGNGDPVGGFGEVVPATGSVSGLDQSGSAHSRHKRFRVRHGMIDPRGQALHRAGRVWAARRQADKGFDAHISAATDFHVVSTSALNCPF